MKSETIQFSPVNMEERKKLGIRAGDTVRVWVKIREKDKTRLQAFEGLVLARKHGNEPGASFTVRKIASGVGVERIFPLYSPAIDKIEIIKRSRVRRSKLYFIREKVAKEIRRQMRKMKMMGIATKSDTKEAERIKKEGEKNEEKPEETKTENKKEEIEEDTTEQMENIEKEILAEEKKEK